MSAHFRDLFSHGSGEYSRYRPTYPPELFDYLREILLDADLVWDCACGTGQASYPLAERFPWVIATDPSDEQLRHAVPHERIDYRRAPAEDSGLPDGSMDLVVVAQALHWFNLDRFYSEVRRVARDGALLVVLTYNLFRFEEVDNGPMRHLHYDTLADDWAAERVHIDRNYADLPFPFERVDMPEFTMRKRWDLEQVLGYIATWSGLHRYVQRTGHDPMPEFRAEMLEIWGEPSRKRWTDWPLTLIAGRGGAKPR